MKVFLSWSGDLSLRVACAFRDWLPSVIQSVRPYVSSEDIDKGSRWSTDIAKELESSSYGVLCITEDNIGAPWINFEAGALSKTIDKARVAPFLVNLKRSEVKGPLLQFQSVIYEQEDVAKLVISINNAVEPDERLEDARLAKVFNVWWPELKAQFDALLSQRQDAPVSHSAEAARPANAEILEELLELTRTQQKLLRSPEVLLPPEYLELVLQRSAMRDARRLTEEFEHLRFRFSVLKKHLAEYLDRVKETPPGPELLEALSRVDVAFEQVWRREMHHARILRRRPVPGETKTPGE